MTIPVGPDPDDAVQAPPVSQEDLRRKRPARVKPANLIYSVDEHPPLSLSVVLGLQHVFVMSVGWIFVVVVAAGIGASPPEAGMMIRMSMIASGLATILQARTTGPIGSGYLCPYSCGPAYVSASIFAGQSGGLSLLSGMSVFSGICESLLSRLIKRMQLLFPPEVTGFVVAIVGIELIGIGSSRFFRYHGPSGHLDARAGLIALFTLTAMVLPTLWSKSKLRLYPVLIGLSAGYLASLWLHELDLARLREALAAPLLGFPRRPAVGLTFEFRMALPFLIASICSVLKAVGDLTLCEKVNDAEWKRTDMKDVSGGILAGSVGTSLAGLLGGVGQSTFSSNVGLSMATGATSRVVAWPAGLICIALAFFPRLAAIFSIMPEPVIGAVLVYVACFMILGGFQVMMSRMLDARRIFVVGISLIFGLSVEMVPGMYSEVPAWIRPLFSSSMALGTVLVFVLNLLLRLGASQRKSFELLPAEVSLGKSVHRSMEELGASWGMRPEIVARAADCLHELMVSLEQAGLRSPVQIQAQFNEFKLELDADYAGPEIHLPDQPPSLEAIASDTGAIPLLSGYLIRRHADSVSTTARNGKLRVHLVFEH
jgi:NCS2 family nucleobase:cation symporter-2